MQANQRQDETKTNTDLNVRGIQSDAGNYEPVIPLAGGLVIALAAIACYLPCIHGGFILDDDVYLIQNDIIKSHNGLYKFWCTREPIDYYPLSNTTLWIEWRLWGKNPAGYHVTNLLLHIASAWLLWGLLKTLKIPGAFLAAMIFAVHPVNVESVAWISQRKDLLAVLFFLLSILWFSKGGKVKYWLSLAAFVAAMLSKGSVAMLPLVLLGIMWFRGKRSARELARLLPFVLISIVLTIVNVRSQHAVDENIRTASFAQRLAGAGTAVWFYLYKALFPTNLTFIYPQWDIQSGKAIWWAGLAAAVCVSAVLWWYRNQWARSWLVAWGFFCVSLIPSLGFVDTGFMKYSLVADHYQHLAIIGVIGLAAVGWWRWRERNAASAQFAAAAVVGILICLTWRQGALYRSPFTLYRAILQDNSGCWLAEYNLGCIYSESGKLPEAIEHFEKALRIKPDYTSAHVNLGAALSNQKRLAEAVVHYREALKIRPNHAHIHFNLGMALVDLGETQEGIVQLKEAVRLKPDLAEAHFKLASALAAGKPQEAILHYEAAANLRPTWAEAHDRAGVLLAQQNQPQRAIVHFQRVVELEPQRSDARNNLGALLAGTGRFEEAIVHLEWGIRTNPTWPEGYLNLAKAYGATGRGTEALAVARRGVLAAQANGQPALAQRINDWIEQYRQLETEQRLR